MTGDGYLFSPVYAWGCFGVGEHLIYVFDGTTGKRLCVLNRDTVAKVIGTQRVAQILTGHL